MNILSSATAHLEEITDIAKRPAFRKATRNMCLATAVLEKSLKPLQSLFDQEKSDFALVLTSETGELETTFDFLKTFAEQKLARPLLFQNSLHNATAGFLSIQLGLTGPVITCSGSPSGPEQAIDMAELLLEQNQCRYCLLLSVDVWPEIKGYQKPPGKQFDGAACLILKKGDFSPQMIPPVSSKKSGSLWEPPSLEQNKIYRLAQAVAP